LPCKSANLQYLWISPIAIPSTMLEDSLFLVPLLRWFSASDSLFLSRWKNREKSQYHQALRNCILSPHSPSLSSLLSHDSAIFPRPIMCRSKCAPRFSFTFKFVGTEAISVEAWGYCSRIRPFNILCIARNRSKTHSVRGGSQ
jgi:hypothetical protein